jgi:hypothetical protein
LDQPFDVVKAAYSEHELATGQRAMRKLIDQGTSSLADVNVDVQRNRIELYFAADPAALDATAITDPGSRRAGVRRKRHPAAHFPVSAW